MREHVVTRRRWLTEQEFLDLLGATNLIPGPNSTEMAIHIGRLRAGWLGLLAGGVCFILPAFAIVFALAWAYVEYNSLPQLQHILYGVKPAAAVVVAHALFAWTRTLPRRYALTLVPLSAILAFAGVHELAIIFGAGACGLALAAFRPSALLSVATLPLFLFFLKVGSILFGSGYVLLAYLRGDLVERWAWLTEAQLLDAVAIGQVTPGPLFTTATFIGYILGGFPGAAAATAGIFLPAFVFVALSGPLIAKVSKSARARTFLDWVNAASLGVMAAVLWDLGKAAVVDGFSLLLLIISVVAMWRFGAGGTLVLLTGAAAGAVSALWGS
jgi:chromate transporter